MSDVPLLYIAIVATYVLYICSGYCIVLIFAYVQHVYIVKYKFSSYHGDIISIITPIHIRDVKFNWANIIVKPSVHQLTVNAWFLEITLSGNTCFICVYVSVHRLLGNIHMK